MALKEISTSQEVSPALFLLSILHGSKRNFNVIGSKYAPPLPLVVFRGSKGILNATGSKPRSLFSGCFFMAANKLQFKTSDSVCWCAIEAEYGVQHTNKHLPAICCINYAPFLMQNLLMQNHRQPAGRGDWHALAAALEEGLEALGILLDNTGAKPSGTFSCWR